nr:glycogen debranching enzyme isoform X1 [Onthophagus taurus]
MSTSGNDKRADGRPETVPESSTLNDTQSIVTHDPIVSENDSGFNSHAKKLVYLFTITVSLWFVLKLLSVSKTLERVTGAILQRPSEETVENQPSSSCESNSTNSYLTLSKPVDQLIKETFADEFQKITSEQIKTKKVGNHKKKKKHHKAGPNHKQNSIKTVNGGHQVAKSGNKDKKESYTDKCRRELVNSLKQLLHDYSDSQDDEIPVEVKTKMRLTDTQVRVLTLNDREHQDSVLYRLEKNWILQFRLGPSLFGRRVTLFTNYPITTATSSILSFDRKTYHRVPWCLDEGNENCTDDTVYYAQIYAELAGSFHYYFTYENAESTDPQGSGFFMVNPVLKYGRNEELPLDGIQCQTVLAKCMGAFPTWENKMRVTKESGYNMVHFTPIQELGDSNSSYSIKDQLKVNPIFNDGLQPVTFDRLEKFISKLRTDWKITSICDIVLNHTANESPWLFDHPEATYNCLDCPYMRPAYLLDGALYQFSRDVGRGLYENRGIPREICTPDHLNAIRYTLHSEILPAIRLHEMYVCDVSKYVSEFLSIARKRTPGSTSTDQITLSKKLKLIQDQKYRRLAAKIDMDLALETYNIYRPDSFDEETRLKKCSEDFKRKLDELNGEAINEIGVHLNAAVDNCISGIRYFRVQPDGPRIKEVSLKNPLVYRYFTDYDDPRSIKEHENIMYSEKSKYLMAHNGWVMNSDPLKNFAAPDSNVYLRRELIAWGDSVKLRYGEKPEDCPYLWQHMRNYVEQTVQIFDGVRLDNCHSTPIPVAEYLLDCARKVRPDLYVVAELFTNSDQKDNIFVNRLGITSLIREAMAAWDSHEEGRLIYRFGCDPVGAFYQPNIRPLVPSIAHAIFLDLTHDNPSPVQKRSVFDLLPSTALVNMANCASGSNRGYDELVPHHIHVVDEKRQYTEWTDEPKNIIYDNPKFVSRNSGIIAAKKALNDLHFQLGLNGYDQVYVDQMDADIVAVTRHNPSAHESVIMVAFTAFNHPDPNEEIYQRNIKPLTVEGTLDEIIIEASIGHIAGMGGTGSRYARINSFDKDTHYINGLNEYGLTMRQHIQLSESDVFKWIDTDRTHVTVLGFKNFKPGSIVAIKVSMPKMVRESIRYVRDLLTSFSRNDARSLTQVVNQMSLADINRALYRCDQEERDEGHNSGVYSIPNYGPLVYCGLQGIISLLAKIRPTNDLGHPLCCNLREGDWLIDYIWRRLQLDEGTKPLGIWFEENTIQLKRLPRYLVPCYFDAIITGVFTVVLDHAFNLMSEFVRNGSTFVRALAMGSVQFGAFIRSANLPMLSPDIAPPRPPQRRNERGNLIQSCISLAAGLPHFSVGYMRNWGRDTFIALRGLLLITGRYDEARYHLLAYAGCLRHGLIPNLLSQGKNARYNCRDAVWWWLYCIKSYVEEAPSGLNILKDNVIRLFPTDDIRDEDFMPQQSLHDVIQEALKVHFQGLIFRERNAGRQIDEHMSDKGFTIQIGVHPETGFVFGGSDANCGTWMDKMGSSDKAGNRGKPATPRDGSAIEIVALTKAVVQWLHELHIDGQYPYDGVERVGKNNVHTKWTFGQWAERIQNNFERHFWISPEPVKGEERPDLIHKRGMYKDCYGATQDWSDFQLRCNYPIAMAIAPELFDSDHAWIALQTAEKQLMGPLGMKTLDPDDWAYNGDYDNSNDSDDIKVAHGFNYHQGPEWVWPMGYFLRAKLHFAKIQDELDDTVDSIKGVLSKHYSEIQMSDWKGLPELTNSNGSFCKDSSRTQAWSMSAILEVLYDLQQIDGNERHTTN